jgi:hypothetical protein
MRKPSRIPASALLLDDEDMEKYGVYAWRLNTNGYIQGLPPSRGGLGPVLLHRLVVGATNAEQVHHRNGCKTDNRKANLEKIAPWKHLARHAGIGRTRRPWYERVQKEESL